MWACPWSTRVLSPGRLLCPSRTTLRFGTSHWWVVGFVSYPVGRRWIAYPGCSEQMKWPDTPKCDHESSWSTCRRICSGRSWTAGCWKRSIERLGTLRIGRIGLRLILNIVWYDGLVTIDQQLPELSEAIEFLTVATLELLIQCVFSEGLHQQHRVLIVLLVGDLLNQGVHTIDTLLP